MSDSATPWTAARQASLSITHSQSSLKLTSIESVMPSNHLIPLAVVLPRPARGAGTLIPSAQRVVCQYYCLEKSHGQMSPAGYLP